MRRREEMRLRGDDNPHDCDEKLNPNVQWPYLSLAAAPLAAYRQALVQTGDYTGDRKSLHALGGALGDTGDKAKYALVKPVFQKVKDDSYAAEKYLADNGHPPKFLGMVGGAIELPYYIATSMPSTNTGTRRSTTCPPTRRTPRCGRTLIMRSS